MMSHSPGSGLSNLWSCATLDAGLDFLKKREMSGVGTMVKKEVETLGLDTEIAVSCLQYIL